MLIKEKKKKVKFKENLVEIINIESFKEYNGENENSKKKAFIVSV